MKSYASIDRIEGAYAVCEVELVDIMTSKMLPAKDKDTNMVDFSVQAIIDCIGNIKEGDILVVEQEDGRILVIYSKDEAEKQRRVDLLKAIMKR